MTITGMNSDITPFELVQRVTAMPGFTSAIGMQVVSVRAGYVELSLPRQENLLQFSGYFHGGVIAGLADHAAGGAVTTDLPVGRIAVTTNLNMNFISPGIGDTLLARATAVSGTGNIRVAQVNVYAMAKGAETLCALATVTLRSIDVQNQAA